MRCGRPGRRAASEAARELGAAATTVLVVVAAVWPALNLLVDGTNWWAPAFEVLVTTAVAAAVSRLFTHRSWPGLVLALVFTAVVVVMNVVPAGTGIRDALGAAGEQLMSSVQQDVAPVRPVPEITAAVTAATGLGTAVVEACCHGVLPFTRRRFPALAVPVLWAAGITVSFLVEDPLGPGVLVPMLLASVLVLALPTSSIYGRPGRTTPAPDHRGGPLIKSDRAGTNKARTSGLWLGTVAASAVAVVCVGLVAPTLLVSEPESGRFPVGSRWIAPGASSGVDPFLDLSRDLRSPLSKNIITYSTDDEDTEAYLRTSVISDLFAEEWGPNVVGQVGYEPGTTLSDTTVPGADDFAGTGYPAALGAYLRPAAPRPTGRTRIGIDAHDYASVWLPLPQDTAVTSDPPSSYVQPRGTSTLRQASGRSVRGGVYRAKPAVAFSERQLRRAPSLADVSGTVNRDDVDEDPEATWADPSEYSTVDEKDRKRIPAPIRDAARKVVRQAGAEGDLLETARALRNHFRAGGYVYSEEAPVRTDGRTGGVAMVERFLQEKRGYCVHYASAFTLMARSQGIPARIAIGYTPGSPQGQGTVAGVTGTLREVNSKQAHAWSELYFPGTGWVAFDPTPGFSGTAADRFISPDLTPSQEAIPDDPVAGRGAASRLPESSPDAGEAPSDPAATASDPAADAHGPTTAGDSLRTAWPLLAAVVLLVLVLALRRYLPARLHAHHRSRILAGGPDAARRAWVQAARIAGHRGDAVWRRPGPEAAATWFPADRDPVAAAAAARLADAVDRERYAPPGSTAADPQALVADLDLLRERTQQRSSPRH